MKEEGFFAQTGEQETQETMAAEEFAGLSSGDSFSLQRHVLSAADAVLQGGANGGEQGGAIEGIVVLPLPEMLSLAGAQAAGGGLGGGAGAQASSGVRFVRAGDDLVIELGAKTVVVEGYFSASPPPTLTLGSGGQLSPSLVASFLEQGGDFPQKYALGWLQENLGMTDDDGGMQAIGEIISTEGQVRVVRDGLVIRLEAGDMVLEGDIISTGEGAEVFMRFTDKMEFRLGEDARLAIDQYLYDDVSSSGLQVLSIIAGAFSYASGLIAGASPTSVKLQTPQGVIGIRGTKILGEVGDGELVVTVLEGRVALLQDDREVAILDESFETLRVDSAVGGAGVTTQISSVAEVLETYDFLDGSEQQLRALEAGERLEDEPIEDAGGENEGGSSGNDAGGDNGEVSEVALLSGGDETYILAPVEQEESSLIDAEAEDGGAVAAADLVENLNENLDAVEVEEEIVEEEIVEEEIVEEEIVEEEIVVEPEPQFPYLDSSLPAGELSFEGSSVGVTFDFSTTDTSGFNDDTDLVFFHGADVSVLADSEGTFDLAVKDVVDATGGGGNDILTGDSNRNTLAGGEGADTLDGSAGDDVLSGGRGDDDLYGGDGFDIYVFGAFDGTDTVIDNGGKILFDQGTGNDYAGATYTFTRVDEGRSAAVTLTVTKGTDTLNILEFASDPSSGYAFYTRSGGTSTAIPASSLVVPARVVGEGSESDPFLASDGVDILTGSVGADWVSYAGATVDGVWVNLLIPANNIGWAYGDTLTDIQNIIGSDQRDILSGNGEVNTLRGDAGDDQLVGNAGDDTLYGGYGVDIILGGDGDDTIDGGTGNDSNLKGGRGADTYIFRVGDGADTILDVAGDTMTLRFIGAYLATDFTDTANFAKSGNNLVISINSDQVTINRAFDTDGKLLYTINIEYGSEGSLAEIAAADGYWSSLGLGGENNPFMATAAADTFTGSAATGADWVSYVGSTLGGIVDLGTPANNTGWARGDTLNNINNLIGSNLLNILRGNSDANILRGGASGDLLDGGAGADTLDGGGGGSGKNTATYQSSSKGVRVDLSLTTAQVDFDGTHGFIANNNEAVGDILISIGNIRGSDHNDWLVGDNNDNRIYGRDGDDRLEGGNGADTYLFNAGDGTDTLTDNGGKIVFDQGTGNAYAGATYAFTRTDGGYSRAATLTVTKDSNIINTIEFTTYPASGYTFYMRSDGVPDAEITAVVPARTAGDGSESKPFLATAAAETITGSGSNDWVSYEDSDTAGVTVFLTTSTGNKGWAAGDTLSGINNIIGSDWVGGVIDDILIGNDNPNVLRGGAGNDILEGGAGADTIDGGAGTDAARYTHSSKGVRVSLLLQGQAQEDFTNEYDFTANNNEAVGDIFTNIESTSGSRHNDWLTGDGNDNTITGRDGNDRLEGGAGTDTYALYVGDGTDTIHDEAGDAMILRFLGRDYKAADFLEASNNFNRDGNNLVITLDKDPYSGIDTITINNAYDTDPDTGTGNSAFTINIEYGDGSYTEVTNEFWHGLTA